MTKRLSGTAATVTDQRDAIDKLEGYPVAPTFIGSAIRYLVPDTWDGTGDAPLGWTKHRCAIVHDVDADGKPLGTAKLDVPADVAAKHQGKEATLRDGRKVTVDLRNAADVPDARDEQPVKGGGRTP